MENESIGNRGMDINYKGSQGQTERAVVLWEEEEEESHTTSKELSFHENLKFRMERLS
jgi:hypothetical protein